MQVGRRGSERGWGLGVMQRAGGGAVWDLAGGCRSRQRLQGHAGLRALTVVALPMFRVGGRVTPCSSRLGADGSQPAFRVWLVALRRSVKELRGNSSSKGQNKKSPPVLGTALQFYGM
eukprot:907131-Prymnesium_polylepis.1